MRMIFITNRISVPRSMADCNDDCTMNGSSYRHRLIDLCIDVCEDLIRFTVLIRSSQR